nr:MAG TPA: minor capsid protein [Caudoviricetes sp.]
MKSNKYWEERKLRRFSENEQRTTEYVKSIRNMYERASRNVKKMLDDVYKNYSNATGINKQKLRELLTKSETEKHFEELKKIGLEKYVKDNYKSRINRLERIQLELYKVTKDLYKKEELKHSELYKEVINNGYYKAVYDTQIGVGYDFNFSNLDKNLIKSLMSEKWHGLNYSERIWNNTEIIANQIKDIVGGGLLSGQSIQKTARLVRERFDVGKFYSERLVRTESNYFHNQADLMAYEEMEVEYYTIIATLDNRTSKICQEKDGKKFKVTEALKGKNFPPFHVNCRTTTSTFIDEEAEKLLIRRARNPITGKNEVIDNVSYEEWKKDHFGIEDKGYINKYDDTKSVTSLEYKKIKENHSIENDLLKTNPKYAPNKEEYSRNCQRCVPTYEMRRRGYDVIAKPRILEYNEKEILPRKPYLVWENPEIIQVKQKLKKSIEKYMEEWGENSRCQICVVWKKHLGGHTFVAERIDGKTRFVDPQINNADASNYFKYCLTRKSYFYRIDNQNVTEYIKDCCENNKKEENNDR